MVLLCETWLEIWAGAELFVKPRGSRFLRSNAQYKNLVSALHFDCSPIRLQATIFGWPNCVTWPVGLILFVKNLPAEGPATVTARKDDAPAADQAAMSNVAGWCSISVGGGLIQTTSG